MEPGGVEGRFGAAKFTVPTGERGLVGLEGDEGSWRLLGTGIMPGDWDRERSIV
jgi:hypothetical protein